MRARAALLGIVIALAACRTAAVRAPAVEPPRAGPEGVVAVTASAQGALVLLDRRDLHVLRRELSERGSSPMPMQVAGDAARGVFYVGNFNGGLARVEPAGAIEALDLG